MKRFVLVAGARPNFMKIAPLREALVKRGASCFLVHTGQHYDPAMSDVFFQELGIPAPDAHLGIGPGDRKTQTKKIIDGLVPILQGGPWDGVIVVGDVTSTAAGALAGVIAGVPVIHVEAGLRSFNWRMPEEVNRVIADHHSDFLFTTEPAAEKNLWDEGIPQDRIHLVGNVMIDTLRKMEPRADASDILTRLGLAPKAYGILTLHRPENVDDPAVLKDLLATLGDIAARVPLVVPMHPRTRKAMESARLAMPSGIRAIDPVGYVGMLALTKHAKIALTDSGGLQEETAMFDVPCVTLRAETERPITAERGTSEIVGRDRVKILNAFDRVVRGTWKHAGALELWDGHAAERIAKILVP